MAKKKQAGQPAQKITMDQAAKLLAALVKPKPDELPFITKDSYNAKKVKIQNKEIFTDHEITYKKVKCDITGESLLRKTGRKNTYKEIQAAAGLVEALTDLVDVIDNEFVPRQGITPRGVYADVSNVPTNRSDLMKLTRLAKDLKDRGITSIKDLMPDPLKVENKKLKDENKKLKEKKDKVVATPAAKKEGENNG